MAALDFVGWLSRAKYSRGNPRSSDQSMVALLASYPPWRHRLGASLLRSILSPSLGSFRGNPRSGSPGSDDGNMCRRSPPWGHRFWSWCWLEGLCGGATCIYLVDDGETRPRGGLGDGHGLMDLRRTVALFDVMVALTTSLARSIPWSFLKMGSRRTATATSKVCAWVLAESLLDQVCS
jgi:hypothetical protein